MHTTDPTANLSRLLDAAGDATSTLVATLEEERDALAHRDRAAIGAIAERKQEQSRTLDAVGRSIAQTLTELGIHHHGEDAVERGLEARGLAGLATAWLDFRARVNRCRDLNLANGRVIAISQRSAERLLDILHGTDSRTHLYGPQGRRQGAGHSGYLAKA
ncbi:MAG: flagellar protein FlgN [Gammaproteobacteria bacterium]|nr:flagellar protein FlgN [Gammaproteobacteria bacterium]